MFVSCDSKTCEEESILERVSTTRVLEEFLAVGEVITTYRETCLVG